MMNSIDQNVADKVSHEVDSRGEVMRSEKDWPFLRRRVGSEL